MDKVQKPTPDTWNTAASRLRRSVSVGGQAGRWHMLGLHVASFLLSSPGLTRVEAGGITEPHGKAAQWTLWKRQSFWMENQECGPLWAARGRGVNPSPPPGTPRGQHPLQSCNQKPQQNPPRGKKLLWQEDHGSKTRVSSPCSTLKVGPVTQNWGTWPRQQLWTCFQPRDLGGASLEFRKCGKTSQRSEQEQETPNSVQEGTKVLDSKLHVSGTHRRSTVNPLSTEPLSKPPPMSQPRPWCWQGQLGWLAQAWKQNWHWKGTHELPP